ncbi:MAG: Hpt domain-containing protein [Magnetococcales bacterium]|nr:Hpt domain-containing protein [Magnetococcales bacterium]
MTEDSEKMIVRIDCELEEIVPAYLENRRKDVVALSEMLEEEAFDAMRVLGHRMKGSGSGYGLDAISDIGNRLEQAAKDQSSADAAVCVAALDAYLGRITILYV